MVNAIFGVHSVCPSSDTILSLLLIPSILSRNKGLKRILVFHRAFSRAPVKKINESLSHPVVDMYATSAGVKNPLSSVLLTTLTLSKPSVAASKKGGYLRARILILRFLDTFK